MFDVCPLNVQAELPPCHKEHTHSGDMEDEEGEQGTSTSIQSSTDKNVTTKSPHKHTPWLEMVFACLASVLLSHWQVEQSQAREQVNDRPPHKEVMGIKFLGVFFTASLLTAVLIPAVTQFIVYPWWEQKWIHSASSDYLPKLNQRPSEINNLFCFHFLFTVTRV